MAWVLPVASLVVGGLGLAAQGKAARGAAAAEYNAAASQRQLLMSGAEMDKVRSGSVYEAAQTQGALAEINAKVKYEASVNHAEMGRIAAGDEALQLRAGAQIASFHAAAQILGLEAQAEIDKNNAQLAEMTAQASLLQGGQAEQESRVKFAEAKAAVTMRLARGNVALDEGSALAVRAGVDVQSEQTAIGIQQKAALGAFGHRVQAENYLTDAAAKEGQAGLTGAASSLQTDLANARANFIVKLGNANADLAGSLATAGLSNDKGMIDLALSGAKIDFENSIAAASTKYTFASSIDPGAAGAAAMLSGFAGMANSASNLLGSAYSAWKAFGGFTSGNQDFYGSGTGWGGTGTYDYGSDPGGYGNFAINGP